MRLKCTLSLLFFVFAIAVNAQSWEWAKKVGEPTTKDSLETFVARDAVGNLYVTGTFRGIVTFGTSTFTSMGGTDVFLIKYDANGNVIWVKTGGSIADEVASDIAIDKWGYLYVSGEYKANCQFGNISLPYNNTWSMYLVKYDGNGNLIWARSGVGTQGVKLATDVEGNVYVEGTHPTTATFGSLTLTMANNKGGVFPYNIFLVKYDSAGTALWAKQMIKNAKDNNWGTVTTDAFSNIYIAQAFSDSVQTGLGTLYASTTKYEKSMVVAKYNAAGKILWAKAAKATGNCDPRTIATDNSGNLYIGGDFVGSLNFGTKTITTNSTIDRRDIYTAKYDSSGNFLWANHLNGTMNYNSPYAIAMDNSGYFLAGLFMQGKVNFGKDTLTATGAYDSYVARYDLNGNEIWVRSVGVVNTNIGISSMVTDGNGNAYVTGVYQGGAKFGSITFPTNVSDIFLAKLSGTTLPLQLTGFTGKLNNNKTQLNWQTTNEQNTAYFGVEKSTDGISYNAIGKVVANNSTGKNEYGFIDNNPVSGSNYYRLRMADKDGSFTYSNVVTITNTDDNNIFSLFPNPASGFVTAAHPSSANAVLVITNVAGKTVKTIPVVANTTQTKINLSGIMPGTYNVVYHNGAATQTSKLLVR